MNESLPMNIATWIGIGFCITQSAMFSGLNLAVFGISRLRLEVKALTGNQDASKILELRKDSNFLLSTILWGNVGINVLLTLLSNSVLAGISAFVFSTVVITFIGEILPQAYFSRNAIRMAAMLSPVLKFYQIILYVVAKPVAKFLDWWIGPEGVQYFRERDLREVIKRHMEANEVDIGKVEGTGAINFLDMNDLAIVAEGETVDPKSIITLNMEDGIPVFPEFKKLPSDSFIQMIQLSGKKWVIINDQSGKPRFVLDSDGFIRGALFKGSQFNPYTYCHRPIIVKDINLPLKKVIWQLKVYPQNSGDDVIDHDIILLWSTEKRVITGADILGRLLRGIVTRKNGPAQNRQ
ncbi:MAG: DUF21 domain-containing protein [Desulfobacterales bacterium]|nr:DUF21 domain-containing protein [Desulfobacterales bacterium]